MRLTWLATLSLGALAACESSVNIDPVVVQWMDWPAEVTSGQPFRTRIVVYGVCALNPRFHAGVSADQSAVTFAPFFVTDNDHILCAGELTAPAPALLVGPVDTSGMAPGLLVVNARTYEIRGAMMAVDPVPHLPARTFGDVIVRASGGGADPSRRNAAGWVNRQTDVAGCSRVTPAALYDPATALVLEDQADTADLAYRFVRGYIHDVTTPICGETRVFHLTARQ